MVTNVYTGRYARAIPNTLSQLLNEHFTNDEIPPFPLQHVMTSDIRSWSSKNDCQYFHLWVGESVKMCNRGESAFDFLNRLSSDVNKIM